jgi:STE24 endopeptidase
VKARSLLLGIAGGLAAGYAAVRAVQAAREIRQPATPCAADAHAYGSLRRRLEVAETMRSIAATLAFAYGPLGEAADRATRGIPAWVRPAAAFAPLAIASALLDLPAAFVEGHALERRYGLTDQSERDWLADALKGAAISTVTSTVFATLLGAAVRRAPRRWPWIAAAGVFPLFVLGNIIVPLYVMPLFNRFEPLDGPLEVRLRALAARFGAGDAEILRMDMSRQTRKANAFVTGIGSTHRIVLGDTLIEHFTDDEISFVVAHELGHYVTKDTWRLIAIGEAFALVLFVAAARAALPRDPATAGSPSRLARIYVTMLLATQVLRPLLFSFSRSREWAADRFALETTRDPRSGAAAFRRLRDQNLADEDPPGWYELFFSSHPSLKRRIEALEQSAP